MNRHCSINEIQDHLDGTLAPDSRKEVEGHLQACPRCQNTRDSMGELGRALRSLPRERVDERFTRTVMNKLTSGQTDSLSFRILEKLAYVFALFFVLALLTAAFIVSGAVDVQRVSEEQTRIQELLTGSASQAGEMIALFSRVLAEYVPFAFGAGSLGMTGTIVAVVMLLALVDRFLVRRFVG